MRLLLDTHALLWWLAGDARLPRRMRILIADEENAIYVSAASGWEIATKYRIGKLPEAEEVARDVAVHVAAQGFADMSMTLRHAQRAGSLESAHRDPFDRMLIAQALLEDIPIISRDRVFDAFGVTRLW